MVHNFVSQLLPCTGVIEQYINILKFIIIKIVVFNFCCYVVIVANIVFDFVVPIYTHMASVGLQT